MTFFEVFLSLLLISISALVSSAEVSLFSLSKFQLRSLKEKFARAHKRVKTMVADPSGLLTTVLLTNEMINISLSALFAGIISRNWIEDIKGSDVNVTGLVSLVSWAHLTYFPNAPQWLAQTIAGVLVSTPIVVFFCDLTPKVIGAKANQTITPYVSTPIWWTYRLLGPLRWILTSAVDGLIRRLVPAPPSSVGKTAGDPVPLLKEEEFMIMVEEGLKEGAINQNEMELIRNVLELDDTQVSDTFTPIAKVKTFTDRVTITEALNDLPALEYSRIPILKHGKTEVVGVVYTKDLLLSRLLRRAGDEELLNQPVTILMRKPMIVHESSPLNSVFRKMKKNQMHLAVVTDEQDRTTGIVTMSGVLRALFEDLMPEEGGNR